MKDKRTTEGNGRTRKGRSSSQETRFGTANKRRSDGRRTLNTKEAEEAVVDSYRPTPKLEIIVEDAGLKEDNITDFDGLSDITLGAGRKGNVKLAMLT